MRPYEMMVLLDPELEDHKATVEQISEVVRNQGGEITKVDQWGKRRLAYPLKKKMDGYYAVYTFNLNPDVLKELNRVLMLRQGILRHIVVRSDDWN